VENLYLPPQADQDAVSGGAVRVQVRNGTARVGLGLIAVDQLGWQGLSAVDAGPADRVDYRRSQIIVFTDKPGALRLLTRLFGVRPENVIQQPDPGRQADMEVILGADYDPCK